jgi:hypothetical protein
MDRRRCLFYAFLFFLDSKKLCQQRVNGFISTQSSSHQLPILPQCLSNSIRFIHHHCFFPYEKMIASKFSQISVFIQSKLPNSLILFLLVLISIDFGMINGTEREQIRPKRQFARYICGIPPYIFHSDWREFST